jgi:hypothetical protein
MVVGDHLRHLPIRIEKHNFDGHLAQCQQKAATEGFIHPSELNKSRIHSKKHRPFGGIIFFFGFVKYILNISCMLETVYDIRMEEG